MADVDQLQVEIDELVEAGALIVVGQDPVQYLTGGLGRLWLAVTTEYAEATGLDQRILYDLIITAELRRQEYGRAVANRLYVYALDRNGYACGCAPEERLPGGVRNLVCRNVECLNYGAHVRGRAHDRCTWCGRPYTLLAEDPLKGAR